MFSMFDDFELNALRSKNTTAQFHKRNQRCWIQSFSHTYKFFTVTSYSRDLKDKSTIATVEAKKYAIYGIQSHPEKTNNFIIKQNGVPQTLKAFNWSEAGW
jgi:anthranilate/para-aminobenzoate synthase component II